MTSATVACGHGAEKHPKMTESLCGGVDFVTTQLHGLQKKSNEWKNDHRLKKEACLLAQGAE